MVELYKTAADFTGSGFIPYVYSVADAVPGLFSIIIFCVWLFGTAGVYFAILNGTARKRFFQAMLSMSFVSFLLSLLIAAMNSVEMNLLSGYWVGFYILMTVTSYFLLDRYE
jgi:hypothetical protein